MDSLSVSSSGKLISVTGNQVPSAFEGLGVMSGDDKHPYPLRCIPDATRDKPEAHDPVFTY